MAQLELHIAVALRTFELDVELSVGPEPLALVGPSGAGKTTVLRAIAGLRRPDRGRIMHGSHVWFDRDAGIDLEPQQRSVGLVFQDYALFPHMTVRANVAFGGRHRVDELLRRLRIDHLAEARPATLSGGERQRVALARALARDPAVLLLDEPLAALDEHTRWHVRGELQDLLAELALPAIVVTHSYADAVALAPRVCVVVDGTVRQQGSPQELAAAPADAFVASFTGANVLAGSATPRAGGGSDVELDDGGAVRVAATASGRVGLAIQPWELVLRSERPQDGVNAIAGVVAGITHEGARTRLRVGALAVEVADSGVGAARAGDVAWATFAAESARVVTLG